MPRRLATRKITKRASVSAPPKSRKSQKRHKRKYAVDPLGTFSWERQPGESIEAYSRFLVYRNMPVGQRSMRKLGVCPSLAFRWASKHRWCERVAAYDAWVLSLAEELATDRAVEMRAEHAAFGRAAVRKAKDAIAALPAEKVKPTDAVNMARAGIEIEREARRLLTENQDEDHPTPVILFDKLPSAYSRTVNAPSPSSPVESIEARHPRLLPSAGPDGKS